MQVFRRLTYGNLMQLNVLDTRRYRSVQLPRGTRREHWEPSRTMLGAEQEKWLLSGLGASAAAWNVLGNQVFAMAADHGAGEAERYAMGTWDGYAADLKQEFYDPDSSTVGAELLGTSITSAGDGQPMDELGRIWMEENPHMKFHNRQRGYQRVHLTPSEMRTDHLVVPYVTRPGAPLTRAARVHVEAGRAGIAAVDA